MKRNEIAALLQTGFETHPEVSLRQLALATDATYQVLLRESRKPVPGVPYDPDSVNYSAVADALIRKHGPDLELPDFAELAAGKKPPRQKNVSWQVGQTVEFRNFPGQFEILMATADHLVFMEIGKTKPRVMNLDTFEHQGPREV